MGQQGKVVTPKIPGWGIAKAMIIETRKAPDGRTEACILPPEHEAPFWVDLQQIAQFRGRFIYDEKASLAQEPGDDDSSKDSN